MSNADDDRAAQAPDGGPQSPEEIRAEIERTQEELGDTIEALAHKTDVKAQAAERLDAAKEKIAATTDDVVTKVRQATPESAGAGAHQVSATVQEKPLPFATAGAFATGVLVGWLLGRR